jgi:excisionase family DNA binding protein
MTEIPSLVELLLPNEVAAHLRVSRATVYRLIKTGELPALHFAGKTVRVRKPDLERFMTGKTDREPASLSH